MSHILIRHENSADSVAFSVLPWRVSDAGRRRSRAAALAIAREVAAKAVSQPHNFGQLARAYSEDDTSRDTGGSLGGVVAINLCLFPRVLDVFAALREGEVSQVVETEFGFHVIRRDLPPADEEISGARIVIQHDEAPSLSGMLKFEPRAHRSREDAYALASDIYRQALEGSTPFAELVESYSEHPDRVRGGDIGRWSLSRPNPFPRELNRLRTLAVGEIATPIDTMWGIQVLQRVGNRERAEYAMEAIKIAFDPKAPNSSALSKASVHDSAVQIADRVHQEPALFDQLREQEFCCRQTERWSEGQEDVPSLAHVLDDLDFGEIAAKPVEQGNLFVVPKRMDPGQVELPPVASTELPAPPRPDVEFFVQISRLSRDHFAALGRAAIARLPIDRATAAAILAFHERDLGDESAARISAYRRLLADVQNVLKPEEHTLYVSLHDAYFTTILLGGSASNNE
jgi:NIMA-interacting peptidyl-prolyl cis-trans isomerase 1